MTGVSLPQRREGEDSIADCGAKAPSFRGVISPSDRVGEWLFVLFLFAGYYKADSRLAWVQASVDLTALFLVLSFLVLVRRALARTSALRVPRSFCHAAALFSMLVVCIVGALPYSQSTQYGFEKAARFAFITGWAFFGAGLLVTSFSSLRRFSWALVALSTLMAIDALLNHPGTTQAHFVTALGSNYIALARAEGLGVLTAVSFLLPTERQPFVKLALGALAGLQLWAMLSAGARGPVVAFIVSFALFLALSARGLPPAIRVERSAFWLGLAGAWAMTFIIVFGERLFPTLLLRTRVAISEGGTSLLTRLALYRAAIDLWAASPIWGCGTGQFGVAVAGVDERLYPHNIVLELGAECGTICVLVLMAVIGTVIAIGWNCLRGEKGSRKTAARYLLVTTMFALLNAMVSGDINDNRILFTMLALLASAPRFQASRVEAADQARTHYTGALQRRQEERGAK